MDVHELLGRTTLALESLRVEYRKLLELLARVRLGEIPIERVAINAATQSWIVLPEPPQSEPARENGEAVAEAT